MGFLENIGGWELIVLILLGLFIFGPERLPKAIGDGLRTVRQLRQMARNATADLSREMGTTIELEDLNPKTFLRKHVLSEADEQALRRPLENIYNELRDTTDAVVDTARLDSPSSSPSTATVPAATPSAPRPRDFDDEAT